jgi:hypothetical protein
VLQAFRAGLYVCFHRRPDVISELANALLAAGPVLSPAILSLEAIHWRSWGRQYAALA